VVNLQFGIVSSFSVLLLSSFLSLLISVSHSSLSNCSGETEACDVCSIKDNCCRKTGNGKQEVKEDGESDWGLVLARGWEYRC